MKNYISKTDYIYDINNVLHIALKNENNSFCYLITVLQRLKCSKTLTKKLQLYEIINEEVYFNNVLNQVLNDESIKILFILIKIYSELNDVSQIETIINLIDKYFESELFVNNIIKKNGYNDINLLVLYYLPLVYYLVEFDNNSFVEILKEINLFKITIPLNYSVYNDLMKKDPFIKNIDFFINNFYQPYHEHFIENINNFSWDDKIFFVCCGLEIYPNIEQKSGHVIALIKCSDDYYIIDDLRSILTLKDFISQNINIYKLCLQFLSQKIITEIEKNINMYFSKTMTRYELVFEQKLRPILLPKPKQTNIFMILFIMLSVIYVISIIILILYYENSKIKIIKNITK